MSADIHVFVVDDHLVVREGLRLIIESEPGLRWVGEAGDAEGLLDAVESTRPDVVLMDVRLPGLDGISAMARLNALAPPVGVVILTTFDDASLMAAAVRGGARGYLLKDADRAALVRVIRDAARGDARFDARALAAALAVCDGPVADSGPLTPREEQVLRALTDGVSNKDIGKRLGITERTVKAHLKRIFEKLGVETRTAAVARALQRDGKAFEG